ncbi:MAG: NAD(+) synthase [Deltaproteobacteria bacterium]|nr:MAG: NAD(+) synthase [Deltaproteobacteria bacterium]
MPTVVPRTAHVAAASLNQTVGDWAGNRQRIIAAMTETRARGAKLLVLPELCISGYSLGDRLVRHGTLSRSWASVTALRPYTEGMVVLVGLPIRHRDTLYNACAVLADGQVAGLVAKEYLATGDVEYENRWYAPWPGDRFEEWLPPDGSEGLPLGRQVFDAPGLGRFAIEICEDGWKGIRPGSMAALAGAHLVLNPSASWFVIGKHARRRRLVSEISAEDRVAYLYASSHGCDATRLVFDGSLFIASDGEILREGRRFAFDADHVVVDAHLDLDALRLTRMEEGSWRQQVDQALDGKLGPLPTPNQLRGHFETTDPVPAPTPYWLRGTQPSTSSDPSLEWLAERGLLARSPQAQDLPHLELELALAMGLREYTRKCGIERIALALSGGRDSAMCALLVHRMHRYDQPDLSEQDLATHIRERFVTAYLATENSGEATQRAAARLAQELGAEHLDGLIQPALDAHLSVFSAMSGHGLSWSEPDHDIALQNVQARIRGSLIWMIANVRRALLLATSNKSEAGVGYTTMDGDTSGGIAPIADVPKSLVELWLRWARDFHGYPSLDAVLGTPATAELRPADRGQTDEDDLMPYDILDRLLYHFVQLGQDPLDIFRALWSELAPRYGHDPRLFAAHIEKFVRLLCFAQWKRERFAISFRVTAFDLDPKTGFRFPPVQAPFTEELQAMHQEVENLVNHAKAGPMA